MYNQESKSFEVEDTPVLTKNFAGVGTRDIENYQVLKDGRWENRPQYVGDEKARAALSAIKSVFDKTQAELNKNREQIENSNELTLSEEELKKAEEIKNHCKGGK